MPKKSRISPFWKQCYVTASVGSNIIGHGCVIGYPAILIPHLMQPNSEIPLTYESASWITSVLGITQLLGTFVSPPIMERFGRRAAHLACTMPVLIGWFCTIMATSFEALIIGRILQGLSTGMLSPLRSVLIGEYTSPGYRGAFLTTVSLTQAFGILFVHLLGSFLSWQQTALVSVFFSFISLVMTLYCPESPSWLVTKNRFDECREVFHWLRGEDEDDELEDMITARMMFEKARLTQKIGRQPNKISSALTTVRKREFYIPIILMIHAFVMVQFSGGTTMAAYSTQIIALIMGPDVSPHFWMIFIDTQRFISNTAAVFVINKMRRRTMIFITGGLCIASQLCIALYTYLKTQNMLMYDAVWIPALLINIQFFTVATGMLPLPNVIAGEVFPLEYRGIGGSITQATMSLSFFIVLKSFPTLVASLGIFGTYTLYAGLLCYCLSVIAILLPETKGKTLQQIEEEFRGRPLAPKEIEEKMIYQSCPVLSYKRKMSSRRLSTPLLH